MPLVSPFMSSIRRTTVYSHDKYYIQIVNKQTTVPPPAAFVYHFTSSHSLSYYLSFFLCWYWESWGFAAAAGGWAVIRDWVVRLVPGLFGNDCIQWCEAVCRSQAWQHVVPWGLEHPCMVACSPSVPWEASGLGAEAQPQLPHLGLDWVGSCVACSDSVSMYIEVTWVSSFYFPLHGMELAIFIIQILYAEG